MSIRDVAIVVFTFYLKLDVRVNLDS